MQTSGADAASRAASAPSAGRPLPATRIVRTTDYARVQAECRRVRGAALLLLVARGPGPRMRVGLTVSRKVGNAVVRNRVKRWLREAVRAVMVPDVPADVVIVARPEAAGAGYHALRDELTGLFARVRA